MPSAMVRPWSNDAALDTAPACVLDRAEEAIGEMTAIHTRLTCAAAKLPVHLYRWTLKPFFGFECRYGPSCSQYALDAIDLNGAWRGSWLALSRFTRCRPGGSSGFDPPPDIRAKRHPFAPWRYGQWWGKTECARH